MPRSTLSHSGQPAVKAAIAFSLGIYLSKTGLLPLPLLFFLCFSLLLIAALLRTREPRTAHGAPPVSLLLLLCVSCAGWFWTAFRETQEPAVPDGIAECAAPLSLYGTVAEEPVAGPGRTTLLLRPDSVRIGPRTYPLAGLTLVVGYVFWRRRSNHAL